MAIEFGIFDHIEINNDEPVDALFERRIATLQRAEAGGFHAFHLAEHHGHVYSAAPSAAVFLAALARETTTLRLIPTVVCLPLHHPVKLFEELAMLDELSHGRLEIGIGKGITPFEHMMFGHPPEEAVPRTEEVQRMLLRAWETRIISSDDSKYYDFLELRLPFDTRQKPYPPLWTAGNVETAGTNGNNFIWPLPMTQEMFDRYHELRAAARKTPGHLNPHVEVPRIATSQAIVIAETDEEAEKIGRRAWDAYKKQLMVTHGTVPPHLQEGVPELDNPLAKKMLALDPIEAKMIIAGTVDTVRDYYVDQAQRGLTNYFILMLPFGDMTRDEEDATLDAFINEVIPAVRAVESVPASV
jgi:alkanesulfonate monooxygenase SsuD/methylene tetrahydromethanopterin reductase-like flavin-dependent oxidoreductase (luciferase family)